MRTLKDAPALLFALVLACGGGQSQKTDPIEGDGDGDGDGDGVGMGSGSGSVVGDGDGDGSGSEGGDGDGAGSGSSEIPPPALPTGPAVTLKIKNTWDKELEFNLDAGWAAQILVWSGTRYKDAVSIFPFPKHCTASCSAPDAEKCPVCEKPESLGALRKAEKRKTLAPGEEFELPWEGEVHVYEKAKGKKKCECHNMAPVPDGTYTVMVCGLRLSKKHRQTSDLQCVTQENVLTFPADGPQVITVELGDPAPPKPKKKKP